MFITLNVRTASIVHGFDEYQREIVEEVNEAEFVTKAIAVARIQSVSEKYLLVTGSHGRVMYWEYDEPMEEVTARLSAAGLLI